MIKQENENSSLEQNAGEFPLFFNHLILRRKYEKS